MDALLDTGCLAGDFVARRIVDRFNIKPVINSAAKLSVCSGLDNTCYDISESVIISVHYLNERVNKINTFETKAIILETSPLDLIIGRATIKLPQCRNITHFQGVTPPSAVSRRRSCKPLEAPQKVGVGGKGSLRKIDCDQNSYAAKI